MKTCAIADSHECERDQHIVSCWACGEDVCRSCSSIISYKWKGQRRRMRFCFNCQDMRKVGRAA